MKMKRLDAIARVAFVVDDAGSGRKLGVDQHAIVRSDTDGEFKYPSVLVGWECVNGLFFVAVHSYLDVHLDDAEVFEIAKDFLVERGIFGSSLGEPQYIIR